MEWIKSKIADWILSHIEVDNRTVEIGLKGKRVLETHVSFMGRGFVIEEHIRANGKLYSHFEMIRDGS